jgi:hypothetical protein
MKRMQPSSAIGAPPKCSMKTSFLRVVALALLILSSAGCSKSYERRLFETPCGDGTLALNLHVTTHPPGPNDVKLWLDYGGGGRKRNVDVLKPRMRTYAPPLEPERFFRLRPGPDDWPVFVNPRDFTPAEYELIRNRLNEVLPEIDAAMASEKPGEVLDYGNTCKPSSTRYLDFESLRRTYSGALKGVRVELVPSGEIWCHHAAGTTLVGSVVERGRKAILAPGYGLLEKAGIAQPIDFVLSCKDARGRTLAAEFEVQRVTNPQYEAAMAVERADRER